MKKIPESEIQAKFIADTGEKSSEISAKNIADYALEFPGKVAARNFTKNPPHFHEGPNQTFSSQDFGSGGFRQVARLHER